MAYLHGAYGEIIANSDKVAVKSQSAPIYVGTAPVHTVINGGANLNRPVVVNSFAEAARLFGYSEDWTQYTLCEAARLFGYSEDWTQYTLCEAVYVHFILNGIGPLILVNCLDVEKCKSTQTDVTANLTPVNGRATINNAEDIVLDSVTVTGKVLGKDYSIAYDYNTKKIHIAQTSPGALGITALSVKYGTVDASKVDAEDIIGSTDGEGLNAGLYAVKDVYQETGYIPSMLLCPGFSDQPMVREQMLNLSRKVNGHFDLFIYTDIPVLGGGSTQMTMDGAVTWKNANGYTGENEKVHFPMAEGKDGRIYHISVLACANKQALDAEAEGIPFRTPSNTPVGVVQNFYFGAANTRLRIDDEIVNEKLNKHGVTSMAFMGGQWVIWGAHTAEYSQETANAVNASETNRMMLYYISNDFQNRRTAEIDEPMSANRLAQIVSEEQARLDGLVAAGALLFGEAYFSATENPRSDIMNGDFKFRFNVTTTPLAKSLTAMVTWTDQGFETYFAEG